MGSGQSAQQGGNVPTADQQFDANQQLAMLKLQFKEHIETTLSMTDRCFNQCVVSFRSKDLNDAEELCLLRCVEKQEKGYNVAGRVFQEVQMAEQQKLAEQMAEFNNTQQ